MKLPGCYLSCGCDSRKNAAAAAAAAAAATLVKNRVDQPFFHVIGLVLRFEVNVEILGQAFHPQVISKPKSKHQPCGSQVMVGMCCTTVLVCCLQVFGGK